MFRVTEYVPASVIWPTAKDHQEMGRRPGYVRGYNLEVRRRKDGRVDWMSCCYIDGEPEEYFNSGYYPEMLSDMDLVPTGRICFRGYGYEYYDPDEHETLVALVPDNLIPRF